LCKFFSQGALLEPAARAAQVPKIFILMLNHFELPALIWVSIDDSSTVRVSFARG
jgi:hypothetical protein